MVTPWYRDDGALTPRHRNDSFVIVSALRLLLSGEGLGERNQTPHRRACRPRTREAVGATRVVCGAGDVFLAAMVVKHLQTNDMGRALHFANEKATLSCQSLGTVCIS